MGQQKNGVDNRRNDEIPDLVEWPLNLVKDRQQVLCIIYDTEQQTSISCNSLNVTCYTHL